MELSSPVAVTGASGFIGSWITKMLLDAGVTVHATVRDPADAAKTAHLRALGETAQKASRGALELFAADLLKPEGFIKAFDGCRLVFHVASPFRIQGVKNPEQELIVPALSGTRHVLEAVNRCQSVTRVVLTSSIVAIHSDAADYPDQPVHEGLWNETASKTYQPYAYSKTVAEREAWKMADAQSHWTLVTINPAFVIGPTLANRGDGTSIDLMLQMVDGRGKSGLPDMRLGIVDERDVAKAHLLAASSSVPPGRHIVANRVSSFPEIAAILREIYGDRYPIPKSTVPKMLMYLVGPFMGFPWRYVRRNVAVPYAIDNGKSQSVLGLKYTPVRDTLKDCIDQLDGFGMINNKV